MSNKKINPQADFLFILFLIVLLIVFFIALAGYRPVTRRAPLVVMIPLSLMVLGETVRVIRRLRTVRRENPEEAFILPRLDKKILKKALQIVVWLIILLIMIYFAGHVGGIAIFLLIFLRYISREPWKISMAVAVGATLGLYVLFEKILMIPLHRGVIYDTVSAWLWS